MSNRQPNGRFSAGTSGNPGGRPRSVLVVQLRAQSYSTQALETLAAIMRSKKAPAAARIAAAKELLDRGFGKSAQTVSIDGERVLENLPQEDLEVVLEAVRAALGEDAPDQSH